MSSKPNTSELITNDNTTKYQPLVFVEDGAALQPCELCKVPVTAYAMLQWHHSSDICLAAQARCQQDLAIGRGQETVNVKFRANGMVVEVVSKFRYLGCPLLATNSDWPTMYWNLAKTRHGQGSLEGLHKRGRSLGYGKCSLQKQLFRVCCFAVSKQGAIIPHVVGTCGLP